MATTKIIPIADIGAWDYLSQHLFPAGIPVDETFSAELVNTPVHQYLPYPDDSRNPSEHGTQDLELIWNHDFTPTEEKAWQRLLRKAYRYGMYDNSREDLIDDEIAILKAWKNRGAQTPTDAQRDAVLDAMVELWRLELKDDN